ncbi:hypothetical protein F2Q68_00039549 [Brassica cretica]|uniref:Uncharacterized protein n=2 Tax=Brassica cretica TaxID=69181 RepID=A0A8S9MMA1_BRACR|nr:hypothetical protein F2Q68_00039549 [Brassica cretica]KAF3496345.1 hypothetical protein DY000_02053154 [Brassica cretica]
MGSSTLQDPKQKQEVDMDVLEIREDKQCNNTPLYSRHLPACYVVGYEKTNNREAESIAVKC